MDLNTLNDELTTMLSRVRRSLVQVRAGHHGAGAGIIWRQDGLILTNYHVAQHGRLAVSLSDQSDYPASLVAQDPSVDLALLKIDATGLPAAMVSDSRSARVGQLVFAIGHPWGQVGFVTSGVISHLGTYQTRDGQTYPYIRSDARLAPGNSGGPLVNATGAVIGINNMIVGGDQGVAIPSQTARAFVESALEALHIPQTEPAQQYQ